MRWVALVILSAAIATGCGGSNTSGASHNDAAISNAKASEASAAQIHAKLNRSLQLHEYAGVTDSFTIPPGGPDVHAGESGEECSINGIYVGKDQVEPYKGDQSTLISPDGNAAVGVDVFQGTPASDCLQAARNALGW